MNSLEVRIPYQPYTTLQQDYPMTITYSFYIDSKVKQNEVKLVLKAGSILEIYSSFDGASIIPKIKEESSPLSLTEQVAKLPFKEQNSLYKLMNTWGCRMER